MEQPLQSTRREEEQQGTLSLVTTVPVSIGDAWEVQYARYFKRPSRPASAIAGAPHPLLVPLAKTFRGSWISSITSLASLRLLSTTTSAHSIILSVTLVDKVIEEHYISKLNFTWPKVSCLTGYSPRGSKVVFMSYEDQVGQIQKFAVRFITTDETERFINLIKEAFGYESNESTSGISKSKTSCESEIVPSFEAENRPTHDWDPKTTSSEFSEPMYRPTHDSFPVAASVDASFQPLHPIENHDGSINSSHLSQDVQGKLSAFPPSFTSLLMNCAPLTELALQPSDPKEVTLKKDIMKYLEDSSFQEMLSKVQKVIDEFGDELLLLPSCRPQQYQ